MRPRPILLLGSIAALGTAAFFAVHSATKAGRAAQVYRDEARALAERRARLIELQSAVVQRRTAAVAPVEHTSAATGAASAPDTTTAGSDSAVADRVATANAVRARKLASYRAEIDAVWGLLMAQLGLSDAQRAAFTDLLCRRQENDLLLEEKAKAEGVSEDSPAIAALDDAFLAKWRSELRDLLGPQGYAAYRSYYADRAVASVVTEFATEAMATDATLSNQAALTVLHALGDASQRKPSGTAMTDTLDWKKARELVQPILSPAQYEVFDAIATAKESERRLHDQLKRMVTSARP
jgi:hypothetical protein